MSALDAYHDLATFLWPCRKTRWMRGNYYLEKKLYHQAIADFEWIVKRFPDDFPAYDKIGDAALVIDDDTKAAHAHGEAFRINPKSYGSAFWAGTCYSRLGNHDKAIDLFVKTLALKPDSHLTHHWVADSLYCQSRFTEALESINKSLAMEPSDVQYLEKRGVIYVALKEFRLAAIDFQQVISREPSGRLYNRLGCALLNLKEYEKSIEALNHAVAEDPQNYTFTNNRSNAFYKLRKYAECLVDMERAAGISQKAEDYNELAWLLATVSAAELRNGTKAVRYGLKACEQGEYKDPAHIDTLAAAYATAGNFFKAISLQTQAMQLAPENRKADFQSRLDLYKANEIFIAPHYNP